MSYSHVCERPEEPLWRWRDLCRLNVSLSEKHFLYVKIISRFIFFIFFLVFPHSIEPVTVPLGEQSQSHTLIGWMLKSSLTSIKDVCCAVYVDASRCFPGQLGTGGSGGWESFGSGPERRQDTRSRSGRSWVWTFQVSSRLHRLIKQRLVKMMWLECSWEESPIC